MIGLKKKKKNTTALKCLLEKKLGYKENDHSKIDSGRINFSQDIF